MRQPAEARADRIEHYHGKLATTETGAAAKRLATPARASPLRPRSALMLRAAPSPLRCSSPAGAAQPVVRPPGGLRDVGDLRRPRRPRYRGAELERSATSGGALRPAEPRLCYGRSGAAGIRSDVSYTRGYRHPARRRGLHGSVQPTRSPVWAAVSVVEVLRAAARRRLVGVMIGGDATTRNASRDRRRRSPRRCAALVRPLRYGAIQWPTTTASAGRVRPDAALIKAAPARRAHAAADLRVGRSSRQLPAHLHQRRPHARYRTSTGAPLSTAIWSAFPPAVPLRLPADQSASEPLPEAPPPSHPPHRRPHH